MNHQTNDQQTNAVWLLNCLLPGCIKYSPIEQIGTAQVPLFKVCLKLNIDYELNETKFEGTACSKKLANNEASLAALKMITLQHKDYFNELLKNLEKRMQKKQKKKTSKKHPASVLNHLYPGKMAYVYKTQQKVLGRIEFKSYLCVDGEIFEGVGESNQIAKHLAAELALSKLRFRDNNQQSNQSDKQLAGHLKTSLAGFSKTSLAGSSKTCLAGSSKTSLAGSSKSSLSLSDSHEFDSGSSLSLNKFSLHAVSVPEMDSKQVQLKNKTEKFTPASFNSSKHLVLSSKGSEKKEQGNAINLLKQSFPGGFNFMNIERSGGPTNPQFKAYLLVKDQIFWGFGNSKEKSKLKAAELALKSLGSAANNEPKFFSKTTLVTKPEEDKDPELVLLGMYQGNMQYISIKQYGLPESPQFIANLFVNEVTFYGVGASKTHAKFKAAEIALHTLTSNDYKKSVGFSTTPLVHHNPALKLNSLFAGKMRYTNIEIFGLLQRPMFKANLFVGGVTFYGLGYSKKCAKFEAAKIALYYMRSLDNNKSSKIHLELLDNKSADNRLEPFIGLLPTAGQQMKLEQHNKNADDKTVLNELHSVSGKKPLVCSKSSSLFSTNQQSIENIKHEHQPSVTLKTAELLEQNMVNKQTRSLCSPQCCFALNTNRDLQQEQNILSDEQSKQNKRQLQQLNGMQLQQNMILLQQINERRLQEIKERRLKERQLQLIKERQLQELEEKRLQEIKKMRLQAIKERQLQEVKERRLQELEERRLQDLKERRLQQINKCRLRKLNERREYEMINEYVRQKWSEPEPVNERWSPPNNKLQKPTFMDYFFTFCLMVILVIAFPFFYNV